MTEGEMLELAAKALGIEIKFDLSGANCWIVEDGESIRFWHPGSDQADSDNMACDLEISTFYNWGFNVHCFAGRKASFQPHDNTIEGRRAGVRLARLQVAAEMGRAKP